MTDDNDRRYDERREAAGPHGRVGNVDHAFWQDAMEAEIDRESFLIYSGYTIKAHPDGRVLVTKGGVNVMPGATWFRSMVDARAGVDILEAVEGDGQRFWHLMRALQWAKGE